MLDELDGEIRRNFERRGWLPLLDISHLPPATLIREFYLNFSVHSYDFNTLVRSWIGGEEYTITPFIVVDALGVPLVQHPIYPYDESPPFDDIMSFITGTSIQWRSYPRITSYKLTEIHYLFFRISCHSIWPISHLHTIPLERCAFLYALVTDAPMSFPHLFIRSLIEVHRSSSTAHTFFFSVFIHQILLHLGLDEFSVSESVHIIAPSFKRLRLDSSSSSAPPPSSTGDSAADAYVDPTATTAPPPSTLDDSDIHRMLETVMTVQAAHGQLLVDMLDELRCLRADLASLRQSPPPPPFDDE